jgi:rhamnogalacturonyl hydrolase YesR
MTVLWRDASKKEEGQPSKWTYDHGLVLKGIEGVWLSTGDGEYFRFIQRSMDHFVENDGSIRTYRLDDYNIDNILPGRNLLMLYKVTGQEKYRKAAELLRTQLKTHPRTSDGGFWHKKIYPSQMWLDGLYMGEPFYAEYSATRSSSFLWSSIRAMQRPACSITAGTNRDNSVGPTRQPDVRPTSGAEQWVGIQWLLSTRLITFRKIIRSVVS